MKALTFLFFLLPLYFYGQTKVKEPSENDINQMYAALPKVAGQYEWTEVVKVDTSLKEDDLYRNAKLFFTNEFKSAKDVIQYDERAEGKIIGKGLFHIEDGQGVLLSYCTDTRDINFTLEIYCKDGRYKYRLYDVNANYVRRASGGSSYNNTVRGSISLDQAYQQCSKGATKKMDRRLFASTIDEILLTIADIKKSMIIKKSDDNF